MSERRGWNELRDEALASPDARDAYDAARIRFEPGSAVAAHSAPDAYTQWVDDEERAALLFQRRRFCSFRSC